MQAIVWYLIIGLLLVAMALGGSVLKRLPLSTSLLYLVVGFGVGRLGMGHLQPLEHAALLERLTEVAVIVSLFSTGLKLRLPLKDRQWRVALRLAVTAMVLSVAMVALVGVAALGLSLGAAVLLGAILSPTDPVLASDVQVSHAHDQDRLRFGLTGEAGLNDGSAFPFVMLGLGLLGLHEVGAGFWRWVALDVLWATAAGLGVGALLGDQVGRLVLYLRKQHREAVGLDELLALGLIALSYGAALLVKGYGFLAVFAAGLALRRIERQHTGERPAEEVEEAARGKDRLEAATHPEHAPAYMANAVLGFNEALERIAEVATVVLLGLLLASRPPAPEVLWLAPVLFLVLRPLSVVVSLVGSTANPHQRVLMAWFGVRGIGSLYYLFYAIEHGVEHALADRLVSLVLGVVAVSIVVHGISVTPLMTRYERRGERRREAVP
ncbi:sodium:proton antiporter [Pyxidicoccus fallax]|uniref:Sodium:proton antiporter n=1 Tax=Pyxidicoccus fallax TaxID=394095 RepID=A0A848LNA7_9BACT|nr:cation:proton antiporter [Pyxidicoccus fallax]NMO19308.1 sodium:proton antiporter [Pyxidicoccus fallax]NPC81741.1 sodium:proton antiporter [Pyxidicoccus fallax]